jgi:hypothetical protein
MSSSGISFATPEAIKIGSYIELSVSWPVMLNQSCALKLVASGKVVRSQGGITAIRLDRHEFRTQASKSFQAAGASAPMAMSFH